MYNTFVLSNGLKVIHRFAPSAVIYSGVYVNVGSRDEVGNEEGMAHFIEHSIFKGTEHRRAYHILNRIDGVGGELNAFTTKEETCIYASALKEHLGRCLELFADVLFHSTFPLHEIEKERDVVVEEINSYKDSPADQIFDDFEELVFAGHPLAHNILGSKRNVRRFTPDFIREFMQRHYTPDRMVVSVVGDVGFEKLIRLCEKYFGEAPARPSDTRRNVAPQLRQFERTENRHTHQVHLLLGCPAPDIFDERKVAFSLLNNMLGGPAMNSRLNVAVREKYGCCYTIESQYAPFSDTGLFYIYAGIDADTQQRARELILRELALCCSKPLSPRQLKAAQRQMIGQMAITNDSAMNEMQSIGKAFLSYDHVDTVEEMARDIMAVTPADIMAVANECFTPDKLSLLAYK